MTTSTPSPLASTFVSLGGGQVWDVMGEPFELDGRFAVIDFLGSGAYGVVSAVEDRVEQCTVAIKKCKKIFQSRTLAKRTLREIRLLRLMRHDNIVKLRTILPPQDADTFSEIYVVFELMETDLAQIIRSPQKIKDQHIQYFTFQLLLAMNYLHSANIVHRDLKPRNLLVNANCCLKVADFGLARVYNDKTDNGKMAPMTDYVTTRWYRAPEVIVGFPNYSAAVDMWAVGCIAAELILRTPLFPGPDTMKQLESICRVLGRPDSRFIKKSRKQQFRDRMSMMPASATPLDMASVLTGGNPRAVHLCHCLLRFHPSHRLSAAGALAHPYLASLVKTLPRHSQLQQTPSNSQAQSDNADKAANPNNKAHANTDPGAAPSAAPTSAGAAIPANSRQQQAVPQSTTDPGDYGSKPNHPSHTGTTINNNSNTSSSLLGNGTRARELAGNTDNSHGQNHSKHSGNDHNHKEDVHRTSIAPTTAPLTSAPAQEIEQGQRQKQNLNPNGGTRVHQDQDSISGTAVAGVAEDNTSHRSIGAGLAASASAAAAAATATTASADTANATSGGGLYNQIDFGPALIIPPEEFAFEHKRLIIDDLQDEMLYEVYFHNVSQQTLPLQQEQQHEEGEEEEGGEEGEQQQQQQQQEQQHSKSISNGNSNGSADADGGEDEGINERAEAGSTHKEQPDNGAGMRSDIVEGGQSSKQQAYHQQSFQQCQHEHEHEQQYGQPEEKQSPKSLCQQPQQEHHAHPPAQVAAPIPLEQTESLVLAAEEREDIQAEYSYAPQVTAEDMLGMIARDSTAGAPPKAHAATNDDRAGAGIEAGRDSSIAAATAQQSSESSFVLTQAPSTTTRLGAKARSQAPSISGAERIAGAETDSVGITSTEVPSSTRFDSRNSNYGGNVSRSSNTGGIATSGASTTGVGLIRGSGQGSGARGNGEQDRPTAGEVEQATLHETEEFSSIASRELKFATAVTRKAAVKSSEAGSTSEKAVPIPQSDAWPQAQAAPLWPQPHASIMSKSSSNAAARAGLPAAGASSMASSSIMTKPHPASESNLLTSVAMNAGTSTAASAAESLVAYDSPPLRSAFSAVARARLGQARQELLLQQQRVTSPTRIVSPSGTGVSSQFPQYKQQTQQQAQEWEQKHAGGASREHGHGHGIGDSVPEHSTASISQSASQSRSITTNRSAGRAGSGSSLWSKRRTNSGGGGGSSMKGKEGPVGGAIADGIGPQSIAPSSSSSASSVLHHYSSYNTNAASNNSNRTSAVGRSSGIATGSTSGSGGGTGGGGGGMFSCILGGGTEIAETTFEFEPPQLMADAQRGNLDAAAEDIVGINRMEAEANNEESVHGGQSSCTPSEGSHQEYSTASTSSQWMTSVSGGSDIASMTHSRSGCTIM